ncbi:MAG TPA: VWA domain-containing protein [Acidobacteriaceae bacterium]|nr:VWA domain-containing protein [Acidobacteriaceae bacterium]
MIQGALAFALSFFLLGAAPQPQQSQQQASVAQQSIPNAPAPSGLSGLKNDVTPGEGAQPMPNPQTTQQTPSTPQSGQETFQQQPPVMPGKGENGSTFTIRVPVNYIMVPVTVRDKHHQLVAGLNWRQFKIYEDGQRQRIAFFSVDPLPLSVAFVIDQSLPADIMRKVNQSLTAITGAFGAADTIAVFTYNTSPNMVTGFTGARGPRILAALESSKRPGRAMGVPTIDGPFATGPTINGQMVDPNLETQSGNAGGFLNVPKEVHPLNDAILAAARHLANQPSGRRRIIYVITDGKESGSKATQKEVIKYLLTNKISVYGTIVGDSAMWGVGYLDKLHLPLLPTDNVMPRYAIMTGGSLDSELSENGIQRSFGEIAASIRNQYTLYYYSRKPALSESRVSIEVDVNVPGLDVTAPLYYYPSLASVER